MQLLIIEMYRIILLLFLSFSITICRAQEFMARVSVLSNRVANNVDKKTFETLQTALNNFVNNRKWSTDNFSQQEKIDFSFLLNLETTNDSNV